MVTKDAPTAVETAAELEQLPPETSSPLLRPIRQAVIFILGMSVVIVGIAMIVLPGPATIVIPAGLAILATEFVWARRWLNYLKRRAQDVAEWTTKAAASATNAEHQQPQSGEPFVKR